MSETRYPAWWSDIQAQLVTSGAMEEGGADKFTIVMHPDDKQEWVEGLQWFVVITGDEAKEAFANRGRRGAYRIGGVPVVVSPSAVPGRPMVIPA